MSARIRVTASDGGENDWFRHRYTRALHGAAQKQAVAELKLLLSVCRQSVDPKVVSAYHEYTHCVEVMTLTEGKAGE